VDGTIIAQLSVTDMRIPIQYALSYPERLTSRLKPLDFENIKQLDFQSPDFKRFPCLGIAYNVARDLGTAPAVLNAADEVCVEAFLSGRMNFIAIPSVIEKVLSRHRNKKKPCLKDIFAADSWARQETERIIGN